MWSWVVEERALDGGAFRHRVVEWASNQGAAEPVARVAQAGSRLSLPP